MEDFKRLLRDVTRDRKCQPRRNQTERIGKDLNILDVRSYITLLFSKSSIQF